MIKLDSNSRLKNSIISLLSLLRHKAQDKGVAPVISISKILDMLKITGMNITYHQLVALSEDPSIASSIKSINKNQLTLTSDDDVDAGTEINNQPIPPDDYDEDEGEEEDGEGEFGSSDEFDDYEEPESEVPAESALSEPAPGPRRSIVNTMAKRAARRAD